MSTADLDSAPETDAARWDRLLGALVLIAVLTAAALLYVRFLHRDRQLWVNSAHDRNAHYLMALSLAEEIRHGHLLKVLEDVNGARVWGPLHMTLAALALLVGGFDYRIAVLPSLAGWIATAFFAFLAARRAAPRWGNLAGLTALLFVLAGPAHRGYATDIMLESLGAGLTMAALYAFLVAVQQPSRTSGRWLGLLLTMLFLEKYNYWLIVLFALSAAALPGVLIAQNRRLWAWWDRLDLRGLLRGELRRPSSWLIAAIVALSVLVWRHGDQAWVFGSHSASLYPPYNIIQIAYIIFFLRLLFWWRGAGRTLADRLPMPWQPLIRWHVWPALVWMLLPKHLGYFLWFLSPANTPFQHSAGLLEGASWYASQTIAIYHTSWTSAVLLVALFGVAQVTARRLRPGGQALLWCFLIGAVLTARHPNQQTRFLHSWMATGWVGAGLGLAMLLPNTRRVCNSLLSPTFRGGLLRHALIPGVLCLVGCLALGGVAWATVPSIFADRPAPQGGPQPGRPSLLELTDFYTPDLQKSHKAVVLTEVPFRFFARWTALQLRPDPKWFDCVECFRGGFYPPWMGQRQGVLDWLSTCDCDTIVSIEDGPDAAYWEWIERGRIHDPLSVLLKEQGSYRAVKRQVFPRHGCVITVWKRDQVTPPSSLPIARGIGNGAGSPFPPATPLHLEGNAHACSDPSPGLAGP